MQIVLWAFLVISNMELNSKNQVSADHAEKYARQDAAIPDVRLNLCLSSQVPADTRCLLQTFWQVHRAEWSFQSRSYSDVATKPFQ